MSAVWEEERDVETGGTPYPGTAWEVLTGRVGVRVRTLQDLTRPYKTLQDLTRLYYFLFLRLRPGEYDIILIV